MAENDQMLTNISEIFKMVNNYFVNIKNNLRIYSWAENALYYSKLTERINFFDNHPSIQYIMHKYKKILI